MTVQEKIEYATKKYNEGYTCSQAVLDTYADEIGACREVMYRMMEGLGGRGGGATFVNHGERPTQQSDCDPYGAFYWNNLCITKKNAGDISSTADKNGLTSTELVAAGITVLDSSAVCENSPYCCWTGRTANSYTTGSGVTYAGGSPSYSGYSRTLCQYEAAKKACEAYAPDELTAGKWRLMTYEEAQAFKNVISAETTDSYSVSRYFGSVTSFN